MEETSPQAQHPLNPAPGADAARSTFWYAGDELRTLWKLLAFIGTSVPAFVILALILHQLDLASSAIAGTFVTALALLGATAFCVRGVDRRAWREEGFPWDPIAWRDGRIGALAGAGMIVVVTGILLASGHASLMWNAVTVQHGAGLMFEGAVLFVFVAAGEELMLRGYVFTALLRGTGAATTLILTSAVFAVMHLGNPNADALGVANIFLAGMWLGMARLVTGSVWMPIGLHFGWNFALGVLAGFPVSGLPIDGLALARVDGPGWLSGGMFGPEAGVPATIVLVASILLLRHPLARRVGLDRRSAPASSPSHIGPVAPESSPRHTGPGAPEFSPSHTGPGAPESSPSHTGPGGAATPEAGAEGSR